MKIPELLAPAGSLEKLKIAVNYGADAVYLGGKSYSLRASADNFTGEEMEEGIDFAHRRGAKVYAAVNIFARNQDLEAIPEYLRRLGRIGVDALIVSDPGVIETAREVVPEMPLHLSTQANNLNWGSVRFWEKQGISRVVLGRELSREEIGEIRQKTGVELEVFVHGAMCLSYSGRCFLSQYLNRKDANRGECTHPCRWGYSLVEEKRPGEYFPVEEDERGAYILSSRDLCLMGRLPELVDLGVDSIKIEGRMKSLHYVATVVRAYRMALDRYKNDPGNCSPDQELLSELEKVSHRSYTDSIFRGTGPVPEITTTPEASYLKTHEFVGLVIDYDQGKRLALVEQRSPFQVGDCLEVIGPKTPPYQMELAGLYNEKGEPVGNAPHPQQRLLMQVPRPVEAGFLVRKVLKQRDIKLDQ
ncbi:MAG: U32 family peptidase [Firmicutes bacterium]|nr:U32 family peptidase [Bacillota bacterium]